MAVLPAGGLLRAGASYRAGLGGLLGRAGFALGAKPEIGYGWVF